MIGWIWLFMSILAVEGTVEVLMKGKIFDCPRTLLYKHIAETNFIGKLIRCPYCTSFWIAAVIAALYFLVPKVWMGYVVWLSFTRGSNILNDISDKIFYSQYGSLPPDSNNSNEKSI
jgi:hypothetical protein